MGGGGGKREDNGKASTEKEAYKDGAGKADVLVFKKSIPHSKKFMVCKE